MNQKLEQLFELGTTVVFKTSKQLQSAIVQFESELKDEDLPSLLSSVFLPLPETLYDTALKLRETEATCDLAKLIEKITCRFATNIQKPLNQMWSDVCRLQLDFQKAFQTIDLNLFDKLFNKALDYQIQIRKLIPFVLKESTTAPGRFIPRAYKNKLSIQQYIDSLVKAASQSRSRVKCLEQLWHTLHFNLKHSIAEEPSFECNVCHQVRTVQALACAKESCLSSKVCSICFLSTEKPSQCPLCHEPFSNVTWVSYKRDAAALGMLDSASKRMRV